MKSKPTTLIGLVVILLVVGGLLYFFLGKSSSPSTPQTGLVSSNGGSVPGAIPTQASAASSTGDQVVALLRNLSVIQLNDAVFQNPSFSLLSDLSVNIPPVTNQGRRDPFASAGYSLVGATPSSSASTAPNIVQ